MRPLALIQTVCVLLSGCMLPRPVDNREYTASCESPGLPPAGSMLFLTTRLPDCRRADANRMTWLRGDQPMHGVWTINGPQFFTREQWISELKRQIGDGSRPPILFIHGFNNDNAAALSRAAAIRLAVGNDRPVIALTWPSHSSKRKYFWDETNADWTVQEGRALLSTLTKLSSGIVIVAHSMGNRVALDLVRSWPSPPTGQPSPIKLLIMASPDVDRAWFVRELGRGYPVPITLYGSTRDQALSASWRSHAYPRAGDLSRWVTGNDHAWPYTNSGGIAVVDTSDIARGVTAHADFIESEEGAADLCRVILGDGTGPGRATLGHPNMERLVKHPNATDRCATNGRVAAKSLSR